MARLKDHKPKLHETGYLTARAMRRNLTELFRAHITPLLRDEGGEKASILDVGCGEQPYRSLLDGSRFVGVNIEATDARPDVVADGLKMPFREATFPAAVCTQVIEHVVDPALLLSEIARCLRPGGMLLLSGPMYWPLHEEPHDYWRFTKHGLKLLLRNNGFELLDMRDDGHATALTVTSLNHLFLGRKLAPLRVLFNLVGLVSQSLWDRHHSTPNITLIARRL